MPDHRTRRQKMEAVLAPNSGATEGEKANARSLLAKMKAEPVTIFMGHERSKEIRRCPHGVPIVEGGRLCFTCWPPAQRVRTHSASDTTSYKTFFDFFMGGFNTYAPPAGSDARPAGSPRSAYADALREKMKAELREHQARETLRRAGVYIPRDEQDADTTFASEAARASTSLNSDDLKEARESLLREMSHRLSMDVNEIKQRLGLEDI